jgi:hypothetical protein
MEVVEVNAKTFKNIIPAPYHVFATGDFSNLNADKAAQVFYLLIKDKKYRLGITGGVRDATFFSPFSAPFGGFVFLNENIRMSLIDEALDAFMRWISEKPIRYVSVTLPPFIYNPNFISKQINGLYRQKCSATKMDLNYSFDLSRFDKTYADNIWRNAKKNLRIALKHQFSFKECKNSEEKKLAYEIIALNRSSRGFPLRMSWSQIVETIELIPAYFFLVYKDQQTAVAAAVVFQVSEKVVQVVYWGDMPEYSHMKTMNFLSYKIFEYFCKMEIDRVDIGPSTEDSIPNYGLCDFKESIGCDIDLKLTFQKEI